MLNTKEVAEIFGVDVWSVCFWVRKGKLPAMRAKDNYSYEFLEQDVMAYHAIWRRPVSGRKR